MKIKCTDESIETVLKKGVFGIPAFQRPYSWGLAEVEEFWKDLISNAGEEYFIGSLIVFNSSQKGMDYGVIDGQQRLTTLTILFCVIRDFYKTLDEPSAKGMQGYIEKRGKRDDAQFLLKPETSFPYFESEIQNYEPHLVKKAIGDEERQIEFVYKYFKGVVEDSLGRLGSVKKKVEYLDKVRDAALDLKVVFIELDEEDSAYVVFETMNTRGLDLSISDMIKNYIFKCMVSVRKVDYIKSDWQDFVDLIEKSERKLKLSNFLHHYWISRNSYSTEKLLFKNYRTAIKRDNVQKFYSSLKRSACLYRGVFEPQMITEIKGVEYAEVRDSLYAISNTMGMQISIPLILSLLEAHLDAKIIKVKHLKRALNKIEAYHYIANVICGRPSAGGVGQMYASTAKDVSKAKNLNAYEEVMADFSEKILTKFPDLSEFKFKFSSMSYSNSNTRQRAIIKYTLYKFALHANADIPLDATRMTIEYIASQSDGKIQNRFKIGNLILVEDKLNGRLDNKGFTAKQSILFESNTPMDDVLQHAGQWNDKIIEGRADFMAEVAYNEIWRA